MWRNFGNRLWIFRKAFRRSSLFIRKMKSKAAMKLILKTLSFLLMLLLIDKNKISSGITPMTKVHILRLYSFGFGSKLILVKISEHFILFFLLWVVLSVNTNFSKLHVIGVNFIWSLLVYKNVSQLIPIDCRGRKKLSRWKKYFAKIYRIYGKWKIFKRGEFDFFL